MAAAAQAAQKLVLYYLTNRIDCLDHALVLVLGDLPQLPAASQERCLRLLLELLQLPAPVGSRVRSILAERFEAVFCFLKAQAPQVAQLHVLHLYHHLVPQFETTQITQLRPLCRHLANYIFELLALPLAEMDEAMRATFRLVDKVVALPVVGTPSSIMLSGLLLDRIMAPRHRVGGIG